MPHDLRTALRSLRRRPGFTAGAVLMLAVAAGVNAALAAFVYSVLVKPLPFQDPERLVAVWPGRFQSNVDLLYLRDHASMLSSVAAVAPGWTMSLTGRGDPARITVARVSGNLFETLGVTPPLGRAFRDADARRGSDLVVLLTHALWQNRFGGDGSIVGRVVRLEGLPYQVVGVLPPGFEIFGLQTDAFTPFALDPSAWYHQLSFSLLVGRLAPGRSLAQADLDYRALIPRMRSDRRYADDYGRTARLQDLRAAVVGDVSASLVLLGAGVVLILVIAGANVGTLLLTRTAARARDIAVRAALGASRMRIARELVAEGAIVACAGGCLGTMTAWLALPLLVSLLPRDTPRTGDIAIGWTVAGCVLAVTMLVNLAFTLAPAITAVRIRTEALLRAGAHSESPHGKRLRRLLVSGEIALALVLAIGAGLMAQTLWRLQRVDPGFNADRVLTMHLQPPGVGGAGDRPTSAFYQLLLEKLRGIPGVMSAGAIQHLPFSGYSWTAALDIEGHDVPAGASRPTAGLRIATPGYFVSIGQPVLAGREFANADATRAASVIVNEAFARSYDRGAQQVLGRRLRIRGAGLQSDWMTIVGVVGDVRHSSLTSAAEPEIYTSIAERTIPAMMVAIRSAGDPLSLVPAVREAVWSIDRDVPISDVQTMLARVGSSLARPRFVMVVLTGFASVGLVLALAGVYGVVAYSVTQRRRELGIRVALGAERARVIRLVLREGLEYAAGGLVVGLPMALAASRLLRSTVFGVTPTDPATYVALALVTTTIVLAACYLPARRAARADPLAALRVE